MYSFKFFLYLSHQGFTAESLAPLGRGEDQSIEFYASNQAYCEVEPPVIYLALKGVVELINIENRIVLYPPKAFLIRGQVICD